MENKLTVGNVCFIFDREAKNILLLTRSREPMKGLVTGVGGKTHFDEDIHVSCIREIKEETGLDVKDVNLRGVIKTLLAGANSSWLLFIYTAKAIDNEFRSCDEGELRWIDCHDLMSQNLIGFIREVLPHILSDKKFVEGIIQHDETGKVLGKTFNISKF